MNFMRNKTLEEVVGNLVLQGLLDEGQEDPMEFASQVIDEWKKYCLPKKRKWLKKGTMVFGGISTKEIQIMNSSDDGFNDCRNHIKQRDKKFMSKKEGK